ncbi:MAG: DUF1638 domain-containing protein [Methanomassiliicoccus sp.]|jgi:hypothetical protein|nr:DUF1638 domain-containing protein [Methanomassiliicoccus sp.]
MKIGIIACETFERGLEKLIKDDPDIAYKEYMEFGLHEFPQVLKRTVVDKVNSLEGKVDAVLLGYGICNSLEGITSQMKVPTVQLVGDDCIGVLITPEEYERERKVCAGTMYHTPYFAKMNKEWFERKMREQMPNYEELGIDMDWYLGKLFDGYSRVLFIDDGLGGIEPLIDMSRQFATDLHLRHECRCGTLRLLEEGLARTKALAREGAHAL